MTKQLLQSLWVKGKNAFSSLNHANEYVLYCLILLLLPTQFGKHFWPTYSLVSGFRVDYLSPTIYVTDLLIVVLLCVVLFANRHRSVTDLPRRLLPYALVLLFLALTLLSSPVPGQGLYSLLKVSELLFFGWYTATRVYLLPLRRIIPRIIFIAVVFQSLLTLLQVQAKGSVGGVLYFLGERSMSSLTPGAATTILNHEVFLRPYGTFSHPNVLAGYLLLMLAYLFFQRRAFSFRGGSLVYITGFIIGTAGLLATLSRIPIVLWGLFFLMWSIFSLTSQRSVNIRVIIGGVITVLLFIPFASKVLTRFMQSSFIEEAVVVRLDLTKTALEVIAQYPVLGVGLGNYLPVSVLYRDTFLPLFLAVQPVHNIFLLVWAETGILGLLLFLWVVGLAFFRGSLPARVLLSLVIVLGFFDHYFLTLQQGQLLLAFILGYCFAGDKGAAQDYT